MPKSHEKSWTVSNGRISNAILTTHYHVNLKKIFVVYEWVQSAKLQEQLQALFFFALTSMCDVLDWPTGNEAATFLRILSKVMVEY